MHRLSIAAVTASLFLAASSAALAAPLLAVDIDDRSAPAQPPGFSSYVLPGTTASVSTAASQVINGYTVTLTPFDDGQDENLTTAGVQNGAGAIDDRIRSSGPTNAGDFTYADLFKDLIFAGGSTGFTGGMDLSISGGALLPNTPYLVSLYVYDRDSTPARSANWYDANNANALVTTATFNGSDLPTSNDQYKFTGTATTDANGSLLLLGRNGNPLPASGGVVLGVFLNGFEVNAVPEPASLSLLALSTLPLLTRRRRRA